MGYPRRRQSPRSEKITRKVKLTKWERHDLRYATDRYTLTHKGRKYCFDHDIVINEIIEGSRCTHDPCRSFTIQEPQADAGDGSTRVR